MADHNIEQLFVRIISSRMSLWLFSVMNSCRITPQHSMLEEPLRNLASIDLWNLLIFSLAWRHWECLYFKIFLILYRWINWRPFIIINGGMDKRFFRKIFFIRFQYYFSLGSSSLQYSSENKRILHFYRIYNLFNFQVFFSIFPYKTHQI